MPFRNINVTQSGGINHEVLLSHQRQISALPSQIAPEPGPCSPVSAPGPAGYVPISWAEMRHSQQTSLLLFTGTLEQSSLTDWRQLRTGTTQESMAFALIFFRRPAAFSWDYLCPFFTRHCHFFHINMFQLETGFTWRMDQNYSFILKGHNGNKEIDSWRHKRGIIVNSG